MYTKSSGSALLHHPALQAAGLGLALALAAVIAKLGLAAALTMAGLPVLALLGIQTFRDPKIALWSALVFSFVFSGLSLYVRAPWGLGLDALLVIGWLGMFFQLFRMGNWRPLRNDAMLLAAIWFGYILLQLANPEMRSLEAWFYAMRGVGFYQLLAFGLAFIYLRHPRHLDNFLTIAVGISILGALWGLRQRILGPNAAENYWLWVENHQDEHVLSGVLRVFSFYSDAGQFGSSQAMFSLVSAIAALAPMSWKRRSFLLLGAALTLIGFFISGTRGALAVPGAGILLYMVVSRNFKTLLAGIFLMGLSFYMLKYTYVLHGVEPVRRMRTALDFSDPSLNARLQNQIQFGNYLQNRPFGGGVGSAGFWGNRFSPGTFLGSTPTDSYYVKIWAETGVVGLCLHLFILGYFLGKGGAIIYQLKDQALRIKTIALYSGFGGVLLASYGNQVFSQMPTGMVMNLALPLIFMAPLFDKILERERAKTAKEQEPPLFKITNES